MRTCRFAALLLYLKRIRQMKLLCKVNQIHDSPLFITPDQITVIYEGNVLSIG